MKCVQHSAVLKSGKHFEDDTKEKNSMQKISERMYRVSKSSTTQKTFPNFCKRTYNILYHKQIKEGKNVTWGCNVTRH